MKIESQGGLAVVTGAAGGLGSAFCHKLAERGYRLLLLDRRLQQLEQVCQSIRAKYGVAAEARAVDLCNREELASLANQIAQRADIDLLVNNAGFGSLDHFIDTKVSCLVDMVDVHVVAPVMLTRALLPGMIERNRGAIINVSSLSAWLHSAGNVQYASTKCFLVAFSMALAQELRGTNVRVQALCPGFIRTEFHDSEIMRRFIQKNAPPSYLWMSAEDVVNCSLRSLSGRQVIAIPGFGYRLLGRLAQMPVFQPLMRWITGVPRLAPNASPSAERASSLVGSSKVATNS